jgi:hypothetical protein
VRVEGSPGPRHGLSMIRYEGSRPHLSGLWCLLRSGEGQLSYQRGLRGFGENGRQPPSSGTLPTRLFCFGVDVSYSANNAPETVI